MLPYREVALQKRSPANRDHNTGSALAIPEENRTKYYRGSAWRGTSGFKVVPLRNQPRDLRTLVNRIHVAPSSQLQRGILLRAAWPPFIEGGNMDALSETGHEA